MVLTRLRRQLQPIFSSIAELACRAGLSANAISLLGLVFALASAASYWGWRLNPALPYAAVIFLLLSGFCDAVDGAIARARGGATPLGGFLDSVLDRYADVSILLGVAMGGLCGVLPALLAISGSLLVSYSRARAEVEGLKMESVGIAERAERILVLAAASILNLAWSEALHYGVLLLAFLTHLTAMQRFFYALTRLPGTS